MKSKIIALALSTLLWAGLAIADEHDNANMKPININTASAMELEAINGVGPALAADIVMYREKNGAFKSVEQLTEIKGIGDVILSKNEKILTVRETKGK